MSTGLHGAEEPAYGFARGRSPSWVWPLRGRWRDLAACQGPTREASCAVALNSRWNSKKLR